MSNLYEILEVSKKASKEVIDKAYHVLAKKYHPDLQLTQENKKLAEAKMQKINEAYDILGNEQKRKIYDLKLEQEIEEQKRRDKQKQLEELEKNSNVYYRRTESFYSNTQNQNTYQSQEDNMQKIQNGILGAFKQQINNYYKRRIPRQKRPWTLNRALDILKGLAILLVIIISIWLFPPTHKLIVGVYEENPAVKTTVDILGQILGGIINGIFTFFKNVLYW